MGKLPIENRMSNRIKTAGLRFALIKFSSPIAVRGLAIPAFIAILVGLYRLAGQAVSPAGARAIQPRAVAIAAI